MKTFKFVLGVVIVIGLCGLVVWSKFYHRDVVYIVQYVEGGAVHVMDMDTLDEHDVYDDKLVNACLTGKLKQGDAIKGDIVQK